MVASQSTATNLDTWYQTQYSTGIMNSVIFGTGEYVSGWTGAAGSKSDKSLGVVALVHFDLRERGLIGEKIALCGTNGAKFDGIRKHFADKIKFKNLPNLSFDQFPQVKSVLTFR